MALVVLGVQEECNAISSKAGWVGGDCGVGGILIWITAKRLKALNEL